MSVSVRFYPSSRSLRSTNPSDSCRKFSIKFKTSLSFSSRLPSSSVSASEEIRRFGGKFSVLKQEGSLEELDDSPVSFELLPICSETQFDRVIVEAQQPEDAVVIVWSVPGVYDVFIFFQNDGNSLPALFGSLGYKDEQRNVEILIADLDF